MNLKFSTVGAMSLTVISRISSAFIEVSHFISKIKVNILFSKYSVTVRLQGYGYPVRKFATCSSLKIYVVLCHFDEVCLSRIKLLDLRDL